MDSMSWILLALCAPVFDTIVNFIDKYLVGEKLKIIVPCQFSWGSSGHVPEVSFWPAGFPFLL